MADGTLPITRSPYDFPLAGGPGEGCRPDVLWQKPDDVHLSFGRRASTGRPYAAASP